MDDKTAIRLLQSLCKYGYADDLFYFQGTTPFFRQSLEKNNASPINVAVNCNDFFYLASCDSVPIETIEDIEGIEKAIEDINQVEKLVYDDPIGIGQIYGPLLWACRKQNLSPVIYKDEKFPRGKHPDIQKLFYEDIESLKNAQQTNQT